MHNHAGTSPCCLLLLLLLPGLTRGPAVLLRTRAKRPNDALRLLNAWPEAQFFIRKPVPGLFWTAGFALLDVMRHYKEVSGGRSTHRRACQVVPECHG